VLLGEVNLPAEGLRTFFGDQGDELQLLFNFPVMERMYLALARQEAAPLADAIEASERIEDCQYANFVRNHDELILDQLSDRERQEVFDAFGPDEDMQLFGRGLRRRLPPMLDGNEQRIRMVYSLLFSLPGTPVLFYGEEIGMGENLEIEGRLSVRSPMQWTDERNGGFSQARPGRLGRAVVEGRFGPMAVNVGAQRRDPDSLLNWMERTIRRRRETPEIGWGTWKVLDTDMPAVLALLCEWEERLVVTLHNLGEDPCVVRASLGRGLPEGSLMHDLLAEGSSSVESFEGDVVETKLEGFGFRWFRLQLPGQTTAP
jgi:glycosidase